MKTKLKMVVIIMMAIMIIGMLTTNVRAVYSAEVEMVPDKTEVNPGDTVNVVVNLVDVVDAGTGATDMAGTIEYDSEFFENITATQGSWMMNEANGLFSLSGNVLTEDGEFAVLQFTVSDNASGTTTVRFTGLQTANGSDAEPTSPDITLTFNVAEDPEEPENPGNTQDPDNTVDPDNEVDDNNTAIPGNHTGTNSIRGNNVNNVTSITRLPNAGLRTGMIIAIAILVVVIIGSYLLYKKYQKI